MASKKKRRQVTLVKDSFGMEEESLFEKLHRVFEELSKEFGGKTVVDITDVFMRVSGDVRRVREYLEGKRVVEWTYLEDIALSQPESSTEYRCLVTTKGKEEVERRKRFLLNVGNGCGM
jgi:hypothetical protein